MGGAENSEDRTEGAAGAPEPDADNGQRQAGAPAHDGQGGLHPPQEALSPGGIRDLGRNGEGMLSVGGRPTDRQHLDNLK